MSTEGDVLVSLGQPDGAIDGVDASSAPDGPLGTPDAPVSCAQPPSCPPIAIPGTLSVCGRVIDLATSQPIGNDGLISVSFFNFLDFGGAPALASVEPDACGRFVAENIFGVLPGFVVMSADDDDIVAGEYVRVVSVIDSDLGQVVRANAYALRTTREQTWASSAGLVGGSFVDFGALAPIFIDASLPPVGFYQGTPVSGVTITENGAPSSSADYYFVPGAVERDMVDPGATTSNADGSGLFLSATVNNEYSGQKTGCTFPVVDGLLFGAIQAQELVGTCN